MVLFSGCCCTSIAASQEFVETQVVLFGPKSLIVAAAAAAATTSACLVTSGSKKADITTVFFPLFGHAPLNPGECLSCFVSFFVAALPTDEGIIIVRAMRDAAGAERRDDRLDSSANH